MSTSNNPDTVSKSAAAKRKKKSKRKSTANGVSTASNGANGVKSEHPVEDEDEDDEETHSPTKSVIPHRVHTEDTLHMPSSPPEPASPVEQDLPVRNGVPKPPESVETGNGAEEEDDVEAPAPPIAQQSAETSAVTTARLDAAQQERDVLRDEVTQLRKQLESIQQQQSEELSATKEELGKSETNREHSESQYRNLLTKVNTIRSQLGERLKADAAELEQAREKIDTLETTNSAAQEENSRLQDSLSHLNEQLDTQSTELDTLRSRTSLSTNNWAKERDDLLARTAYLHEEYDVAKQAMQDWEILATEERARREALEERMQTLDEQLLTQRDAHARAKGEAETQSSTVDGLQRALRDVQEERKRELREMVESTQEQLDALREQTRAAEASAAELTAQLALTREELSRAAPFEKEVKEKNLLIGKLRHEAVILNDHLTKALRFLKRGKPEDSVDRQLVTNHLLHFVQLERSDPKKFQVLQLIAALLGWDETQRESAGLLRSGSVGAAPGGSFASTTGSLRIPMSPFRRTPSTPALSSEFRPESPGAGFGGTSGKETLAELWSEFLEREAESGSQGSGSRRGSLARGGMRSPSSASVQGLGLVTSPTSERAAGWKREGDGGGT